MRRMICLFCFVSLLVWALTATTVQAEEVLQKKTTDAEDSRASALLKTANSGMRAHEQGRYDEAMRLYSQVIDSGILPPQDNLMGYLCNNRGLLLLRRGNYRGAVADFSNALKGRAEAMMYVNRAKAWTMLGEDDKALEDADKAIELAPESSRAYNQRAIAYLNKGMPGRARQDIEKVRYMYPFLK